MSVAEIIYVVINLLYTFAALIFLFETEGDPWLDSLTRPRQELNFFDCIYFSIVTGSTVGYGDITPKTALGRF